MTYDDCEFCPGPRLNVVIGPNGTGKSSIVCALALGLGGNPNILGRAKEYGDFIKLGEEDGFVEIELAGTGSRRNLVIKRNFTRNSATSWKLNGKSSNLSEIKAIVEKLNIQVHNLCQFLPQERVVSFSELSPQALLRETEKAIGKENLITLHDTLIELGKQRASLTIKEREHARRLNDLKQQQKSVEKDVLRFQQREACLQKILQLEMKKPWLECDIQKEITSAAKLERDEALKAYKEFQEKHVIPLSNEIKLLEEEKIKTVEMQKAKLAERLKSIDEERRSVGESLIELGNAETNLEVEERNLKDRAEDRKKHVERLIMEIEALRKELQSLSPITDLESHIKTYNIGIREKSNESRVLQTKQLEAQEKLKEAKNDLSFWQKKLTALDDMRKQRLERLRTNDPDAFKVFRWCESNRNLFRMPVFGPLVLEMNVPDSLHAKYLEHMIPGWLLTAMITQCPEDRDVISEEIRKQNFSTTCVNASHESFDAHSPCDIRDLEEFGITHFLDQVFDAPPIIKAVLCRRCNLHMIAAGSHKTEDFREKLLHRNDLQCFLLPDTCFSKTISHYGKRNVSTRMDPLKHGRYLMGVDTAERQKCEKELNSIRSQLQSLENELNAIQNSEKQLQQELKKMKQERDELVNKSRKRASLERTIGEKQKDRIAMDQEEDTAAEINRLRKKGSKIAQQREQMAVKLKDIFLQLTEKALENDFVRISHIELCFQLKQLKNRESENENEFRELRKTLEHKEQIYRQELEKLKQLKKEAEEKVPMNEETIALFRTLPNSLEELEAEIAEQKVKADMNYSRNSRVIEEYEARQVQINELQEQFDNEHQELSLIDQKITSHKEQWLVPLQDLIAKINFSFSKYFTRFGCAGEVSLVTQLDDFEQYAIEIRVKFREEDAMQKLDHHHQSGGERSVSTMLYLISLQEIAPCPFRLVDEINQGMDPFNERKIFEVISECSSNEDVPQYFLITPKLLPNLQFTETMTILCIFNGPWQVEQKDWNLQRLLRKK